MNYLMKIPISLKRYRCFSTEPTPPKSEFFDWMVIFMGIFIIMDVRSKHNELNDNIYETNNDIKEIRLKMYNYEKELKNKDA
jgi:hypothetical protein